MPNSPDGDHDAGLVQAKRAQLRRVLARLRRYDQDLATRDDLIRDIVRLGVSQAEVARWCRLERMRVSQIVRSPK